MSRHHSLDSLGESASSPRRLYEDYPLTILTETVLSLVFIGLLVYQGPYAWIAYGLAGIAGILFVVRLICLMVSNREVMDRKWSAHQTILILMIYGALFYIRDQYVLMWLTILLMAVLLSITAAVVWNKNSTQRRRK